MRTLALTLMSAVAALTISGCSTRIADLTVASTKNININSTALSTGKRADGKDSVAVVLFPIGTPSLETAIDRAIEQDRCAVGLSNVVINNEFFVFLVGYAEINVTGNLIIDSSQPGCSGAAAPLSYAPVRAVAPAASPSSDSRSQQIKQLQRQNLPYEEYQRRYKEIVGE